MNMINPVSVKIILDEDLPHGPYAELEGATYALHCPETTSYVDAGRIVFGLEYTYAGPAESPLWIGLGVGKSGMRASDILLVTFTGADGQGSDTTDDARTASVEQFWSATYGVPTPKSALASAGVAPHEIGDCGYDTSSVVTSDNNLRERFR